MKISQRLLGAVCIFFLVMLFAVLACAQSPAEPKKDDIPFPTYGKGRINVYIHTDYFCPPCRAAEPKIEPALEALMKQGIINITFVDTPTSPFTSMYVKYFFYALKTSNNFAQALKARRALFEAADKKIIDEEKLKAHLKKKNIAFTTYDIKPVFKRLNDLLNKNKIRSTPSCVIEKDGKSETFIGGEAILNALKALK